MKRYERAFRSLEARGGERTYWELLWPGECILTKIIVKQVGGDNVAFTIDIFNARIAVSASVSSGGGDPEGDYAADPDNYRVCDTIDSESPGKLSKFFDYAQAEFINQDVLSHTNRKKKIYVEIEPQGSGDKTWDVTLGCEIEVG